MDEFKEKVIAYLKPSEGQFNYKTWLHGHLNTERFKQRINELGKYKTVIGCKVLCSGCGSGGDMYEFLMAGAGRIDGVDVNEKILELCKARLANFGPDKFSVAIYDGKKLPYKDNTFDIAASFHVIEHSHFWQGYLSELIRVLKPSGVLRLDFPNKLYPFEAHTGIAFIHLLPRRIAKALSALLCKISFFNEQLRYRLKCCMYTDCLGVNDIKKYIKKLDVDLLGCFTKSRRHHFWLPIRLFIPKADVVFFLRKR